MGATSGQLFQVGLHTFHLTLPTLPTLPLTFFIKKYKVKYINKPVFLNRKVGRVCGRVEKIK